MASGDVFYDLAFLLMDLWERGHANAANIVLNTYLAEAGIENHVEALAALPLFLSLRAAIRAKVTLTRAVHLDADKKPQALQSAQDYFRLACNLIAPPPARLVAIGGLSGTGKSMLARGLAPHLGAVPGAVIVRSDVMRKHLFGKAETQTLPPDAYTPDITAKIYDIVAARAARIARTGHAAIADAVFAKADERNAIAATAQAADVAFTGLMLMADVETRIARVSKRTGDASDADAAIALRQEQYELGPIDWIIIDANGTPDDTLARACKALDEIDAPLPRAGEG
jgi:predicted kinase